MRSVLFILLCAPALAACASPKILYRHSYVGPDKAIEMVMQPSGDSAGSGVKKTNLFNMYMRVCDQAVDNSMANCKDTLILENVDPQSL